MSVSKITDKGFEVHFKRNQTDILNKNGEMKMVANRHKNLYYIEECCQPLENREVANTMNTSHASELSLRTWHRRTDHLNVRDLIAACNNHVLEDVSIEKSNEELYCEVYLKGKMTRLPFPSNPRKRLDTLEIIHTEYVVRCARNL